MPSGSGVPGFPAMDPRGIEVRCHAGNWERHERLHPAIRGHSHWAASAIRYPDVIHRSTTQTNCSVYYKKMDFGGSVGVQYMRVATADEHHLGRAHVKSAHPASVIQEHEEEPAWQPP